jgi:molecular chaperone GrpE
MTGKRQAEAAAYAAADEPEELTPAGEPEEASEPGGGHASPPPEASGSGAPGEPGVEADGEPGVEPTDGVGVTPEHQHDVERYLDELAAKADKADEYLVLAQRTRADFENYRKRAAREAALAQERGIARLAKELLPALDNLDRAVQAAATASAGEAPVGEEADSQLVSGIRLVQADVLAALARAGIEPFSPVGEPFDPQWHEAVAQLPVEGSEPGTVAEVYQQGYRLGETVLRAARVLVAA